MPNYITYRVSAMAFNTTYNNISELNPTTIRSQPRRPLLVCTLLK